MIDAELDSRLRALLSKLLATPLPAKGEVSRQDQPAWDSLKHVDLIFLIEDEFDVMFSEEDMAAADSLSALAHLVRRRAA